MRQGGPLAFHCEVLPIATRGSRGPAQPAAKWTQTRPAATHTPGGLM